jgi:hypothetical protein
MAVRQFSAEYRDAAANLLRTTAGSSPVLKLYTGSIPANCAASATGTMLASGSLPATAMTTSSGGAGEVEKSGSWIIASAAATGTPGYYRVEKSGGAVVEQGDVSNMAGSGACKLINTSIVAGQPVEITEYSFLVGGA